MIGKQGIEKYYEDELKGVKGKKYFQKEIGINCICKLFTMEENIVRREAVLVLLVKYVLLVILKEKNQ